jgi:type I restriction enzyme S subunit
MIGQKAMNAWSKVRIGDALRLINGRAFKPSEWKERGLPIVRIQNLNNVEAPFNYYEGDLPKKFLLNNGDLLFAWSGTPGTSFGAHIWRGGKAWLNQHIFKVIFDEAEFDKRFLRLAINQNLSEYIQAAHGAAGLAHITKGKFERSELIKPTLDEQRNIVAEIEKQFSRLDEAVASLKRVKANLKRYKAAVLKAAVEGKLTEEWRNAHPDVEPADKLLERILAERRVRWKGRGKYQEPSSPNTSGLPNLPHGWTWARWEQIGFSQNGRAFPSAQYQASGFKLLRPGNLHVSGKVVWTEESTRCMPRKWADEFPEFIVGPRELIMNLTAQSLKDEFLGRVCLTGPGEACLLNQRQARLTPVLVIPEFLLWLFKSPVFRRFVDGLNTGSLIQHMFTSQLADFVLPLPSLDDQQQIVAEVERRLSVIDELEAAVETNLTRTDKLRQSILTTAFSGKLVPSQGQRISLTNYGTRTTKFANEGDHLQ